MVLCCLTVSFKISVASTTRQNVFSGTLLRVVSTSINLKGRIVSARAEVGFARLHLAYAKSLQVYDKKTGILIATGMHSINPLVSFRDTAVRRAKL